MFGIVIASLILGSIVIYGVFCYLEAKLEEIDDALSMKTFEPKAYGVDALNPSTLEPKAFGVSILILKDGKILAVARRNDPNMWGMPGGKVDEGETEKEAAIRECYEETGLRICNLKEVIRRSVGTDTGVTFTCEYDGEPSTQLDEPECAWKDPEVLMTGIFGDYNTNLFKKMGIK